MTGNFEDNKWRRLKLGDETHKKNAGIRKFKAAINEKCKRIFGTKMNRVTSGSHKGTLNQYLNQSRNFILRNSNILNKQFSKLNRNKIR